MAGGFLEGSAWAMEVQQHSLICHQRIYKHPTMIHNLYHLTTNLINCPLRRKKKKKPCTMLLNAKHLASTHRASSVVMLTSSGMWAEVISCRQAAASWFTAHVVHTCLRQLRKWPSEALGKHRLQPVTWGDTCTPCSPTCTLAASLRLWAATQLISQAGHGSGLQMRWHALWRRWSLLLWFPNVPPSGTSLPISKH